MNYVKFSTNVPKELKFAEYNRGKEVEGKYGKQYYWGKLQEKGQEVALYATERLNEILEAVQPAGKTLEITKYEDGNIKKWKITEAGIDITPSTIGVAPKTPQNAILSLSDDFKKRLELLEKRVSALEGDEQINVNDIPF